VFGVKLVGGHGGERQDAYGPNTRGRDRLPVKLLSMIPFFEAEGGLQRVISLNLER